MPTSTPTLANILDVTLRDGGYLNRWQFSHTEIRQLLAFLQQHGIQHIELGFLQTEAATSSVINGCPIDFLADIKADFPTIKAVAMLNPAEDNWQQAVAGKLPHLSLIRLTCTAELVEKALTIATALHQQSDTIQVSINLICISSYTHEEIAALLAMINAVEAVDRVYFADSRGALYPEEIPPLIALAQQHCQKPLGFHAHDTLGNAIENSNLAFSSGCDLIDVSLNGFGLAGGNTPLVAYLVNNGLAQPELESAARQFCEHFTLQQEAQASRQLYTLMAEKNIDPIWSDTLVKRYPHNLPQQLASLPRQIYKTCDQVHQVLQHQNQPTNNNTCSLSS